MLVTRARVRPGESVLIWGIGGGVSSAALRISKLVGARAIVTSSSDAKLDVARQMGADVALNHTSSDLVKEIRSFTGERGVDVVVENVGEATWETSLRVLAKQGRLVTCGATTGPRGAVDIRRMFWHQWTLMGSTMGSHAEFQEIVRLLGLGHLQPVIDSVYRLDEAVDAFRRLQSREHMGKVVVEIG
jgi:NADPH:quinone reductase-like Zn-dependent oxidoreductase